MKKSMRILIIIAIVFCLLAGYGYWLMQESYAFRQVKKIAPVQNNTLVSFYPHIRENKRPEETFNFPIALGAQGPSQSLYSGPNQYPFYCMSLDSGLGQPNIDNHLGYGVPVYDDIHKQTKVIGYSKDCGVNTRLSYYQLAPNNQISKLTPVQLTAIKKTPTSTPLFRVEQGSINRFIYTIVMPINVQEIDDRLAQSQWNKRLIYQFNGGSGIGYRQGRQRVHRIIERQLEQLTAGYAVISSSGNRTSYTYNMLLAEDTARRVKKHFISLYGQPIYTVGIGGSGGGLAQYLIAQNSQGILDGLIPLYSYPDMITQTIYALDCDLLNNYFTFRAENRRKWQDWSKRRWLEGMNAMNKFPQKSGFLQPMNQLMAGFVPTMPKGNSECINGWFGLSSFINNPKQGFIRDFFHPNIVDKVNWSYWQDISHILGQDAQGNGLSTWDNVGVQYGLNALVDNHISIEDFLDINRNIGSWKQQTDMVAESIITPLGRKKPIWLSLWGNQNITEPENGIAKRHSGSIAAMKAAYRSGQVFIGKVDLPIIDVRHYLEDDLDMHHVSASFYSRLRLLKAKGNADNHIIWIADKAHDPVMQAFDLMDEWLLALKQDKRMAINKAKPKILTDSCFAADGSIIAAGKHVWDGQWNDKPDGECQTAFPMYSTSRIQAGGTWGGDIFKCQLIPITRAIAQGYYGEHDMTAYLDALNRIFPEGVCDYSQPDIGRPEDI